MRPENGWAATPGVARLHGRIVQQTDSPVAVQLKIETEAVLGAVLIIRTPTGLQGASLQSLNWAGARGKRRGCHLRLGIRIPLT